MQILDEKSLKRVIQVRPLNSHKGNFGKILTVGGTRQYGGAIIMSTSAAIHAGAGLVSCASSPLNLTALHTIVPEAMFIDSTVAKELRQAVAAADVIVIGPGLGTSAHSLEILSTVLQSTHKEQFLIIDGSAITLLADNRELLALLHGLQVVFTPHQMEWQRLSGIQISAQTNAQNLHVQQALKATVVLKKYQTVIYHLDGSIAQLKTGGPYMATGGMGDTLTGIIAAFLGQFHTSTPEQVVDAAVYIHSAIAAELSRSRYVVLPTDIIGKLQEFMLHALK
ncbi:NAD(P)H-hydrate dehydratase [Liquorilactobacillus satsumensis]|uniref:ADP-dependent (S)-NAD(P)H-hydrate dehydratase n=2 Tax=Liquorilactobacillus satsumensis TaxID=259059 RepID=A0A0R1UWM2_9LACO|nr:NAD(P)H-hydrate dehydratase [Liquorilactobacillus satsumensis]KRL97559.1 sugar kinase [Liquorilactobacillus satsumensis DSM 16230 = JCM 12392]MCP9312706.1 NAD(P)H-hydrate dehydratase [Liquorilactobacillus satsumensis]MCP9327515.1 NAD(P)H-hydrate dehydratase [Liquorilactobacillus satsumensis]MCP9359892.1 NAD(P)H-hydrate dehydratase [Liquorilactobacillus satsumensis]